MKAISSGVANTAQLGSHSPFDVGWKGPCLGSGEPDGHPPLQEKPAPCETARLTEHPKLTQRQRAWQLQPFAPALPGSGAQQATARSSPDALFPLTRPTREGGRATSPLPNTHTELRSMLSLEGSSLILSEHKLSCTAGCSGQNSPSIPVRKVCFFAMAFCLQVMVISTNATLWCVILSVSGFLGFAKERVTS